MREGGDGRKPKLYEIFQGEVASLQAYGAFIKIPQCRKQGLLHKSQMSSARIDDPAEMLAKGEKVFCKIISMMEDGEKISLSMKVVNQTTGQDLDPNNVQSSQDEKKRRQWNFKENNRIELGAELNTTCRRCGGHGHLTMDCFVGKGDNQYDLMPEMNKLMEMVATEVPSASKKKKKKKEKKKSKKKKRQTSDSDDSEEERRVKKKSHSKEKKRKKTHDRRDIDSETGKPSRHDHFQSSDDSGEEVQRKFDRRIESTKSSKAREDNYEKHRFAHENDDRIKINKTNKSERRRSSTGEHFSRPVQRSSSRESGTSTSSRDLPRKKTKSERTKKSSGHEKHRDESKPSHSSHRGSKRHSDSEETSDLDERGRKERRKFSHKEEIGRRKREQSSSEERNQKKMKMDMYRKRHRYER